MRKGKEIDLLLAIRAKARSAVLASYPTDTASGAPANFPDGADGVPVVDLKAAIDLTQAGSGLPSSDNIRPITLWTGATISRSGADTSDPEELTVSWQTEAGNVCAGTLDVTTGLLTATRIDVSEFAAGAIFNGEISDYVQIKIVLSVGTLVGLAVWSDRFSTGYSTGTVNRLSSVYDTTLAKWCVYANVPRSVLSSADQAGIDAWVSEEHPQFVVELAAGSERTYQLTPRQLKTLLGENNIWADTGDVTVEYRADLEKYIEKKTGG